MKNLILFLIILLIAPMTQADKPINYKELPDEFYQKHLSKEEYYVCRQKGTEYAYSGEYDKHYEQGTYTCKCCGSDFALFSSTAKYDSGTGWPSFYEPVKDSHVKLVKEGGIKGLLLGGRVEVQCARCGSHLGHVFDDGPADKTGKRFCMNSVALDFTPIGEEAKNKFFDDEEDKESLRQNSTE